MDHQEPAGAEDPSLAVLNWANILLGFESSVGVPALGQTPTGRLFEDAFHPFMLQSLYPTQGCVRHPVLTLGRLGATLPGFLGGKT